MGDVDTDDKHQSDKQWRVFARILVKATHDCKYLLFCLDWLRSARWSKFKIKPLIAVVVAFTMILSKSFH